MSSTTNTAAAEYGNFATKLNGDNPQGYKTMTKVSKNVESNVSVQPVVEGAIVDKNYQESITTINGLNFSDLKAVRDALQIFGSASVMIDFEGVTLNLPLCIINQLFRAGFYHSAADETAKIKAGTVDKSEAVKKILARWALGYYTATEERQATAAKTALIGGTKAKASAYGRNEILGVMSDNAIVSEETLTALRGYSEELWSVFLVKNMDNTSLKRAYSILEEAAATKAKAEFNAKADLVLEL
jgi:hypothetical protein